MSTLAGSRWERPLAWARAHPFEAATLAAALGATLYTVGYPLAVVTYPPLVDLPFHAAATSILRHYFDPAFRFREQFTLAFLKSPYWTQYGLGALLAWLLPLGSAVKVTTALLLATLPAGLAILARGMKKSPYLGLTALALVWTHPTHWGFINHMAALGFATGALGLALLVLEEPTLRRRVALALTLVLVLVTHVFRYPFVLASLVAAAGALFPATRRFRPLLLPVVPSLALFALWALVRDPLNGPATTWNLGLHFERLAKAPGYLFDDYFGPEEQALVRRSLRAVIAAGVLSLLARRLAGATADDDPGDRRFRRGAQVAVLLVTLGYLVAYLTLPMSMGVWWYIFPREAVSVALTGLALLPDLPRKPSHRLVVTALPVLTSVGQARFVAEQNRAFEAQTADFRAITRELPMAPRLAYLMLDVSGTRHKLRPLIHLPAWVQAEKGGALSFQLVSFKQSPIRYREGSPDVPPPTRPHAEWEPAWFDVAHAGKFFDWFLVRSTLDPEPRLAVDPELTRVAHVGLFWLYRRMPRPGSASPAR